MGVQLRHGMALVGDVKITKSEEKSGPVQIRQYFESCGE